MGLFPPYQVLRSSIMTTNMDYRNSEDIIALDETTDEREFQPLNTSSPSGSGILRPSSFMPNLHQPPQALTVATNPANIRYINLCNKLLSLWLVMCMGVLCYSAPIVWRQPLDRLGFSAGFWVFFLDWSNFPMKWNVHSCLGQVTLFSLAVHIFSRAPVLDMSFDYTSKDRESSRTLFLFSGKFKLN